MRRALLHITTLLATAPALFADEQSSQAPVAVLEKRNLKRMGFYFVLPGEKQLERRLESLKPLQAEVTRAAQTIERYERHVASLKQELSVAIEQRRRLGMTATDVDDQDDALEYVARMNELTDRINGLQFQINSDALSRQVHGQVARVRDEFTGAVLEARRLADATLEAYESLAQDSEVTDALASAGAEAGRHFKLGPRGIFHRHIKELKRFEVALLIDDIPLRREGGVLWVDVILNDSKPLPMVLDTGASMISLPARYARELGMIPTPSDPVVRMQTADGSIHVAHRMLLSSVRLGRFEAKAVECSVLPPSMTDAPPLLGQSFLSQFSYEIDASRGMVTLTALNTEANKRN